MYEGKRLVKTYSPGQTNIRLADSKTESARLLMLLFADQQHNTLIITDTERRIVRNVFVSGGTVHWTRCMDRGCSTARQTITSPCVLARRMLNGFSGTTLTIVIGDGCPSPLTPDTTV